MFTSLFFFISKKGVDYTIWTDRNRADDYKFIYNKVNDGQTYKRQTDTKLWIQLTFGL